MAAILKVWRQIEIRLRQSMRIYLNNIRAWLYSDPIWKLYYFRLFWRGRPNKNKKKNSKMSGDITPVPDLYIATALTRGTIEDF